MKIKITDKKKAEKDLGFSLDNYCFVTPAELQIMSEDDYKQLVTIVHELGKYKFTDIGIYQYEIKEFGKDYWYVQWSIDSGDPTIYFSDFNALLDYDGDGEWYYSLLRPCTLLDSQILP